MKVIRCTRCGKFYDAESYQACPHCPPSAAGETPAPAAGGNSSGGRRPVRPWRRRTGKDTPPAVGNRLIGADKPTESELLAKKLSDFQDSNKRPNEDTSVTLPAKRDDLEHGSTTTSARIGVRPTGQIKRQDLPPTQPSFPRRSPADEKTVALRQYSGEIIPVTGWLVCVQGAYKGKSFELQAGRNGIGRIQSMQIALANESSIERERHAWIVSEPNKNRFYLQRGEGETMLGEREITTQPVELKSFDEITCGEARFIFVRLCGSRFNWDKYDKSK